MLQFKDLMSLKVYAFLGEPGTGKTHGVANVVEQYVEVEDNPVFIIQAKFYQANHTWRSI